MNPLQHIEKVIDKRPSKLVAKNRLRLKVSIDVARLCVFQGIAFRAHNEHLDSHNHGNALEIIKYRTSYNGEVRSIILENAPQNAFYTSPQIQKEILSLYASRIQRFIREEIGDAKYCLIVDGSRNKSKREQMAIDLRFVGREVHVENTKASTLKREIFGIISHNNLILQNIRGQWYDGASTMRGEWNGLQALFLNECPNAYYVHYFAHRLQLTLVAITQSVIPIEHFFTLGCYCEFRKNQIGTVQHPGDTRWGSHLKSLLSLLDVFDHILLILSAIINDKNSLSTKASVDGTYDVMTSFEFVFILHFMVELLKMTDDLCRILQCKSQDILNAIDVVANTKELVQKFRKNGWDNLFDKVKGFYEKHKIDYPRHECSSSIR
ncbi:hypothetical protein Pfo_003667 [Paulownia fortunei]|nr:hypothetical protein Pfo_003667 [Paulownia fortunei]